MVGMAHPAHGSNAGYCGLSLEIQISGIQSMSQRVLMAEGSRIDGARVVSLMVHRF